MSYLENISATFKAFEEYIASKAAREAGFNAEAAVVSQNTYEIMEEDMLKSKADALEAAKAAVAKADTNLKAVLNDDVEVSEDFRSYLFKTAREAREAVVKAEAAVKAAAALKAEAAVKTAAAMKAEAAVKTAAAMKTEAVLKAETTVKADTAVKAEAALKAETAVIAEAAVDLKAGSAVRAEAAKTTIKGHYESYGHSIHQCPCRMEDFLESLGKMDESRRAVLAEMYKAASVADDASIEQIASNINNNVLEGILDGEVEVGVTFEDPQRIALDSSWETWVMGGVWDNRLDYRLFDTRFIFHLSSWLRVIFFGDYFRFMEQIEGLSDTEIARKLEMRETLMRRQAIFHVVLGARKLNGMPESLGHIKILEKMLDLGARMDIHDVSGTSPLQFCCPSIGKGFNKTSFVMAKMLLEKGANLNIQDWYGAVPLLTCVISDDDKTAKLFLDFGADVTVKNHIGMGVLDMLSPKLEEIFFVEFEKRIKKVMSSKLKTKFKRFGVATGLFKKRESCESPALKRCLGCYKVWCLCQKRFWKINK